MYALTILTLVFTDQSLQADLLNIPSKDGLKKTAIPHLNLLSPEILITGKSLQKQFKIEKERKSSVIY